MKTSFYFSSLLIGAALLCSCEPTPRTAISPKDKASSQDSSPKEEPTPSPVETAKPEPKLDPIPEPEPEPVVASPAELLQENPTRALLRVNAAQQKENMLRPWQKESVNYMQTMGVYLGDGLVLTAGQVAQNATYIELRLPDDTLIVPAKVVSYDPDINLALVSVLNEKDAAIFSNRIALPLGNPLHTGDKAEYWGSIAGQDPLRIPVEAKGSSSSQLMPRLLLQSPQNRPKDETFGYPIVRDGKLVALSSGFDTDKQSFIAINGELIKRFVSAEPSISNSVPVLGIGASNVNDPVMNKYLQLDESQGGLYISEVNPIGAAQNAGLQKDDVIIAINDLSVDKQGTIQHPSYGRLDARILLRSMAPAGESIKLSISRQGETMDIDIPLDREAADKALIPTMAVGEQARYLIHGGLLFQPLNRDYINALQAAANGNLPEELLALNDMTEDMLEKGYTELTGLTYIIPCPAMLGYEKLAYCLVEQVNGKPVRSFDELATLLDEPTENGITSISINKAPYTIYLKQKDAGTSNDLIRRSGIPRLRQMKRKILAVAP